MIIATCVFMVFFLFQTSLLAKTSDNLPDRLLVACVEYQKCGIMNLHGEFILKPIYKSISPIFINGYSITKAENSLFGLMDIHGNWKLKPTLDTIYPFSEGLAAAVNLKGKSGFIDYDGNWVIEPKFDYTIGFLEGFATARVDGKAGLINKKGEWVVKPQFKNITEFDNGLALVEVFGKKDEKNRYGYINTKGEWVIPPEYSSLHLFLNLEWAKATKYDGTKIDGHGQHGYIDKKGRFYLEKPSHLNRQPRQSSQEDGNNFQEESSNGQVLEEMRQWRDDKSGKIGFKDQSGKWVIAPQFDAIFEFAEDGLYRACKGGKWGIINKKGEWIVRPQYESSDFVGEFRNGIAMIETDKGLSGIINIKGKYVLKPKYDNLMFIRFVETK
jgi:hypothetical protein